MLHEELLDLIEFEMQLIEQLFQVHAELFARAQQRVPLSLTDVTALGAIVHSFYNGLENIFVTIAKQLDHHLPGGDRSHRALLDQMQEATSARSPVLTAATGEELADYLGFRHFFRHSYSFYISWDRLEPLVLSMPKMWQQVKTELDVFNKVLKDQGEL